MVEETTPRDKEAPAGKHSHYLHLADGTTVRFAVDPENPNAPFPTSFNGVRVVSVDGV